MPEASVVAVMDGKPATVTVAPLIGTISKLEFGPVSRPVKVSASARESTPQIKSHIEHTINRTILLFMFLRDVVFLVVPLL